MNTHQILIVIVDTRILGCVADSLQKCGFASISPPDYKDTEASIFCSEIIWIAHDVVGKGKKRLRGEHRSRLLQSNTDVTKAIDNINITNGIEECQLLVFLVRGLESKRCPESDKVLKGTWKTLFSKAEALL
jgi:hypothetical protein